MLHGIDWLDPGRNLLGQVLWLQIPFPFFSILLHSDAKTAVWFSRYLFVPEVADTGYFAFIASQFE